MSELFYFESKLPQEEEKLIKFFSAIAQKFIGTDDLPVWKAPELQSAKQGSFGFSLQIANASVTERSTNFTVDLSNTSLIGFESSGAPRFSESRITGLNISLPHGRNSFIIGGLRKSSLVRSKTGIPFLKDIPILGWLFSTDSTSVKKTVLAVVGECVSETPAGLTGKITRSQREMN